MERLDFAVQLRYWMDKLGMTDGDVAKLCKVAPGTVSRWANHHSAPHELGRQSVIDQLRALEPITKDNLGDNIKEYLKNNLRIVAEEQTRYCYYEGDPVSIEVKLMLGDEVISTDWVSIYP